MATKKHRIETRRKKREALEARQKERQLEIEATPEDEEELTYMIPEDPGEQGGDVAPMAVNKEDDDPEEYMPPTSFEELDALRVQAEQQSKTMRVVEDTETLVLNILYSDLPPDEKVDALQGVAQEFGQRISEEIPEVEEKDHDDLDLLEIEAIMASDENNIPVSDRLEMLKAKLTAARENALSDDQFALVVTRDGKKVRKYPIHDKAHVRNALARAAQMIKRGGDAAADARSALPKIRAAAKKMGIGVEKEGNSLIIEKDARGDWRMVGRVSNNFLDRDGDIITEAAHKEYAEWWEAHKEVSPAFVTWHTPGTAREQPIDLVMFHDGFLIVSCVLTEKEAAGLLRVQKKTRLGMSHGSFVLSRDPKDLRCITKYRMYEVSDLPVARAANPFTAIDITKEVAMDKKAYLADILGPERAKKFLEQVEADNKSLQGAGVASKEEGTPAPAPEAPTPAPAPVEAAPAAAPAPVVEPTVPAAPAVAAVTAEVLKELDLPGLNDFLAQMEARQKEADEKIKLLEQVVKTISGDRDQALAAAIAPPTNLVWAREKRASQAQSTEVPPDDKLAKAAPGVPTGYWLSEVTGTQPVKETS